MPTSFFVFPVQSQVPSNHLTFRVWVTGTVIKWTTYTNKKVSLWDN